MSTPEKITQLKTVAQVENVPIGTLKAMIKELLLSQKEKVTYFAGLRFDIVELKEIYDTL